MEEQIISFKTAKLAKEKGFNEPQFNGYLNEQLEKYTSKSTHEQCIEEYYLAPTQILLQKLIREIHNIHITIFSQSQESWMYRITKKGQKLEDGLYGEDFYTYEEALEEGLYQALLLI